jgi:biopolymer transport protein ExbD
MGMTVDTGGGSKTRGKKVLVNINVVPYIDILLVLLIVFMVITPIRQMELDVKVPQSSSDAEPGPPDPNVIVVSINDAAEVAINGVTQSLAQLGAELRNIYSARANKDMFISASPKLPYGDIVRIIDIAKGSGVGDIGLITEEIH